MGMLLGFFTALALALVGYLLAQQQRRSTRRDEQIEAVAALRYELQANLEWIDDIVESKIYLRDEAWCVLKNKGYISYLPTPIPMKVILTYQMIHFVNQEITIAREATRDCAPLKVQNAKTEASKRINDLIRILDDRYPAIGKNFEVEPTTADRQ